MTKPDLPVIIRYEDRGRADKRDWHLSEILAVFPTQLGDSHKSSMACYSSIGQHSSCAAGYIGRKTKPATPKQVKAMLAHLRGIGYRDAGLRVVSRASVAHRKVRCAQLNNTGVSK
jgi:hypothetical protein